MPRVSVVTPFHNTAEYLAECIESVLAQTFRDFEYLLVDNASRDDSLQIAERYAASDPRIRVVHFDELLPQIANYNRALRLADPGAEYCKMAQADDLLLPRCLEEMLALADSDATIALVGAYSISQNRVFLDGLDYYERVIEGDELCRRYLLDGSYIFGNPTTQLYRMADVRARDAFFPEGSVIADADVAVRLVLGRKFGFVHQALFFCRRSNASISKGRKQHNLNILTRRMVLEKYGRRVLDPATFARRRRTYAQRHYRVLGEGWLLRLGPEFWQLHRDGLADAGLGISRLGVAAGAAVTLLRYPFNLEASLRRLCRRLRQLP